MSGPDARRLSTGNAKALRPLALPPASRAGTGDAESEKRQRRRLWHGGEFCRRQDKIVEHEVRIVLRRTNQPELVDSGSNVTKALLLLVTSARICV